ncbi:DUF6973 domain-containing protein [Kitasatospora sp. NPDC058201]|uniref:DUF6973 domain-containing protein n=1 Tax=unclassified Kitasatospora TaxID=2633591 RepID=UPI00365DD3F4
MGALDCYDVKQITGWSAGAQLQEYGREETEEANAFRHFTWQAMITVKYGRQNAEMAADAHEAFGARAGHDYADHISDLVNNEYGRKLGEKIASANPGASDAQLRSTIVDEARKYLATGDYARPSDFK